MKGILFKPDMIQAIRDKRKTVTRRVIKPQFELPPEAGKPYLSNGCLSVIPDRINFKGWAWVCGDNGKQIKPRYQVGETAYIKEAHYSFGYWEHSFTTPTGKEGWRFVVVGKEIMYLEQKPIDSLRESGEHGLGWYKRTPLFMPAWAARHFLKITDVRAERLQGITPEDCVAEGVSAGGMVLARTTMLITGTNNLKDAQDVLLKCAYQELWDSINGKGDFALNKWVFRYEFRATVDTIKEIKGE